MSLSMLGSGNNFFLNIFFFCPQDVICVFLEAALLDAVLSVRTRSLSVEFGGKVLSED